MNREFVIYEEPRETFNLSAWIKFRDKMTSEVAMHPDRPEAKDCLDDAIRHIEWLNSIDGELRKAA